jgi:pimeloyl-ACP methyl ester carboxylesterase
VELDGVGHVPQLQCPERLADEVLPWLAELDALRAGA